MMVRFRFGRETSLTAVGSAPGASARVMEPWSLAETGTKLASGAIGIRPVRFAFGRGAGPPEFPTTLFAVEAVYLTKRLSRRSATRMIDRILPMICPPTAPSVRTRLPNSAATLMCDPCPLLHALTAASVLATIDWTLRRTTRRLGVERRAACQRQGSEVFDALDKKRRHRRRADLASWPPRMLRPLDDETRFQMLQAGSWYPTIASLGLSWSPVLADAGLRR